MKAPHAAIVCLLLWMVVSAASAPPSTAARGDCGQPASTGTAPSAADALFTLRVAIGISFCELAVCDVDASCAVTAGDALRILRFAVGQTVDLSCGCGATTSTSLTTTTAGTRAATWTEVQGVLAANSCTAVNCHGLGGFASGGLIGLDDFDIGHANLVGAPVQCAGSLFTARVVVGDPERSFMMAKIEGRQDCGERMPQGLDPLSDADLDTIRSWIAAGALKN